MLGRLFKERLIQNAMLFRSIALGRYEGAANTV